jgi:hypothetical protein
MHPVNIPVLRDLSLEAHVTSLPAPQTGCRMPDARCGSAPTADDPSTILLPPLLQRKYGMVGQREAFSDETLSSRVLGMESMSDFQALPII